MRSALYSSNFLEKQKEKFIAEYKSTTLGTYEFFVTAFPIKGQMTRNLLSKPLRDKEPGCHSNKMTKVHDVSDDGSTRRIDMIAFRDTNKGWIIDPTIRMESHADQPIEVHNEKCSIYNATISYYKNKYQLKDIVVLELMYICIKNSMSNTCGKAHCNPRVICKPRVALDHSRMKNQGGEADIALSGNKSLVLATDYQALLEDTHIRKLLQEEEDPVDGYECDLWSDHQSDSENDTDSEENPDPEDNNSQPENDDYFVGNSDFGERKVEMIYKGPKKTSHPVLAVHVRDVGLQKRITTLGSMFCMDDSNDAIRHREHICFGLSHPGGTISATTTTPNYYNTNV
ncbi:hypothetical protein C0J52_25525 [Blattella germanica]|nr:hypothetical protein C0J52_25525 [Blattella germanica]